MLGPTLFNVHINGISGVCQNCHVVLYADDTEIHASSKDIDTAEKQVNLDLDLVSNWLTSNGLISNTKKSEVMLIGSNHAVKNARELEVVLDDKVLKQTEHFKYLGVNIDNRLSWNNHVSYVSTKIYPKLKMLNRISSYLSRKVLLRIYKQTILPILDYACIVWTDCGKHNAERLERLQNQAMRIILSSHRKTVLRKCETS